MKVAILKTERREDFEIKGFIIKKFHMGNLNSIKNILRDYGIFNFTKSRKSMGNGFWQEISIFEHDLPPNYFLGRKLHMTVLNLSTRKPFKAFMKFLI